MASLRRHVVYRHLSVDNSKPTLTGAQLAALNVVYAPFRENGEWPRYGYVDKVLDRGGFDVREVLPTLPPGLMQPGPGRPSFFPQPTDELALTVAGVAYCDGSDEDVESFLRALRIFVQIEERHEPQPAEGEPPRGGSAALVAEGMPYSESTRVYELLKRELGVMGSGGGSAHEWSFELRPEIRRFRGVGTLDEYLARRLVPPEYPGLPIGAIVERLAPALTELDEAFMPRRPAARLWLYVNEKQVPAGIVVGLTLLLVGWLATRLL